MNNGKPRLGATHSGDTRAGKRPTSAFRAVSGSFVFWRMRRRLDAWCRTYGLSSPAVRDDALRFAESLNRSLSKLPEVAEGPLVSIIMPVWNRASVVDAAISSIVAQDYQNWELLLIDDGSTDDLMATVADRLSDPRIVLIETDHHGVSSARNLGLAKCRGEIVTYLDSDNSWYPHYLTEVVRGFAANPEQDTLYLAQVIEDRRTDTAFIRSERFDRDKLQENNIIDLNVFAHRRQLYDTHGGFDTDLTRLVDWDLILRYTGDADPVHIPVVGGIYNAWSEDRVTTCVPHGPNRYRLLRKHQPRLSRPLKVLYVLWHYPHLSESYVRWEMACMRRWGVDIEIWSNVAEPSPAPFETDFPIHTGPLSQAIERTRPDLVHAHWCGIADTHRAEVAKAGLPMTVRAHSFPLNEPVVDRLQADPSVAAIFMFPDKAAAVSDRTKVRPMPVGIDGLMSRPEGRKDRRLVLRAGAAVPNGKDHRFFLDLAKHCPGHRFVMATVVCQGVEGYADELRRLNESMGHPIDLRFNLPAEAVAALTREAGIYLHTKSPDAAFGMPISIAESMASGCYVLARDCPAAADYLGEAGATYRDESDAARLIAETVNWRDADWDQCQRTAVEHAFHRFSDHVVFRPMLDLWLAVAGRNSATAFSIHR